MPMLDFLNGHQFLAFFAGATGTLCAAIIAYLNLLRTHRANAVKDLKAELKDLRPSLFQKAVAINAACVRDAWAILTTERAAACTVLAALAPIAHCHTSKVAWHAVLTGAEYGTLVEFLKNASPLIVVLRDTDLTIDDDTRPYNGVKVATGRAVLRAIGVRLTSRCGWH